MKKRLFITVVAVSGWVGPAIAQTSVLQDRSLDSNANDDVVELGVSLDVRHEGNSAGSDRATASARGLKIEDQRVIAGIDGLLRRSIGRAALEAQLFAGYEFHRVNKKLDRERLGASVNVQVEAGPCMFTPSIRAERRQSELFSIAIVTAPGIDAVQNAETVQNYHLDVRCGRRIGIRPVFGLDYSSGNNSNTLREISDYHSDSYFAGVGYQHPSVGSLSVIYTHRSVSYPKRDQTLIAALSGFTQEDVKFEVKRNIGTRLTANGSVGRTWITSNAPGASKFSGINWSLRATAKVATALRINLSTTADTAPSLGSAALFSRNRSYQGSAVYMFNSRLSVSGAVNHSKRAFENSSAILGPALNRDEFTRLSASLSFTPRPRLSFALDVGQERRNSDGTIYDYQSGFIGLRSRILV